MGIENLVADAPHDDTGIISVTGDPASDLFGVMLVKKACVVKFCLRDLPHVKALAVNEYAHFGA